MAGRKERNIVEFFPHFAGDSKTKTILKSRYGNHGYAVWFQLLELLCQSDDHYYDFRDEVAQEYLLSRISAPEMPISATEILELLARLGKIDHELWGNKVIWCPNLVNNLKEVYRKRGREAPKRPTHLIGKSISATGMPISATGMPISATEIRQSRVEYSRVENSRVEQSKGGVQGGKREKGKLPDSEKANPASPAETARLFFDSWKNPQHRSEQFQGFAKVLGEELEKFCLYWTEPSRSGKKVRWEMEKTWEISRRIASWMSRRRIESGSNGKHSESYFDRQTREMAERRQKLVERLEREQAEEQAKHIEEKSDDPF